MAKIQYTDKQNIRTNASVPEINKVTDQDMNEIKNVVNENADDLENTKELIPTKVSQLENDSGFINRADEYLSIASLDAFKTHITSNLAPARAYLFSLSINGQGQAALVQKTSNLYASFILFGYATAPVLWKCVNGAWTSQNL